MHTSWITNRGSNSWFRLEMLKKGTVVLVSQQNVFSGQGGAATYVTSIVDSLSARGWHVSILLLHPTGGKWAFIETGSNAAWDVAMPFGIRLGTKLWSPFSFIYRCTLELSLRIRGGKGLASRATVPLPVDLQWALKRIEKVKPVAILANYAWLARALIKAGVRNQAPVFCLTHDVLSEKTRDFQSQGFASSWWGMTEDQERAALADSDVVVAINTRDQATLQSWFPKKAIVNVPAPFEQMEGSPPPMTKNCLFVGSDYSANVDGITWFLEKVWPLVLQTVPDATLSICGKVCGKITGDFPGVVRHGIVDDLGSHYRTADLVVAPLRVGSGLKIKVVEALSHGRPVATTSVGAQGIEQFENRGIYLGDCPVELSSQVIRLLSDTKALAEATKFSREAGAEFTPERSCRPLFDALDAAAAR